MEKTRTFTEYFVTGMKLFILAGALSNFVYIFSNQRIQTGSTISFCAYCPWYDTWSFANEPSVLLLASILLLIRKTWSYVIALGLTGYIMVFGLLNLARTIFNFGIIGLCEGYQQAEPSIFLIQEMQVLYSMIIFLFSLTSFLAQLSSRRHKVALIE